MDGWVWKKPGARTITELTHTPPNTQTTSKVSITKYLGIALNTRLGVEDNVVSAANKTPRMLFHLKRSITAITHSIFSPLV